MDKFEEAYENYLHPESLKIPKKLESDKEEIIAVRKNDDGNIIAIKTNMGRELDYSTAIMEAKEGNLGHVDVFQKYGRDILRSEPDGIKENNLGELPGF